MEDTNVTFKVKGVLGVEELVVNKNNINMIQTGNFVDANRVMYKIKSIKLIASVGSSRWYIDSALPEIELSLVHFI